MLFALVLLLACRPSPLDSEAWVDAYVDAFCSREDECGGGDYAVVFTYGECSATVSGLAVPPSLGCTVNEDVVQGCITAAESCDYGPPDPCGYTAESFWSCPT